MRAVRLVVLGTLAFVSACASAPLREADVAALGEADLLVGEGCYDCLIEARDTYERLAVGRARPLIVTRLFETEILIALRERELAMDWEPAEARAEALLPELAAEIDGARVLAAVRAVLPDASGVSKARLSEITRARRAVDAATELAWLRTVPLSATARRYVEMSFDCSYRSIVDANRARVRPDGERPEVADDAPALLRYRAALCFSPDLGMLQVIAESSPRFVEAALAVGRARVFNGSNDGAPGARELLQPARARFPDSRTVTYVYGNYRQLVGDCREALQLYAETIALEPLHEDATLGQAVCHSHLKQHQEAIAAAGRLIEWDRVYVHDAYYWIAWNHHVLGDLPAARANIDRAKTRASTPEIHTLAGVIEHDQDDIPPAERDLDIALGLAYGDRNCIAMWYLGLVHIKQERWLDSARGFEHAMGCYRQNVLDAEASKRTMELRTDLEPEFKANQIAGFDAAITEDSAQYHAAAFNAANQFTRGGDIPRAKELIEVAAKDPALGSLVAQLREVLRKIGG